MDRNKVELNRDLWELNRNLLKDILNKVMKMTSVKKKNKGRVIENISCLCCENPPNVSYELYKESKIGLSLCYIKANDFRTQ